MRPRVRVRVRVRVGVRVAVLLVVAGVLAACGTSAPRPADGPLPTTTVNPYVDVSAAVPPDLGAVADATGQRDFVLAFALAGPAGCDPAWGGVLPIASPGVTALAGAVRGRGGQVTVATGGAHGPYLENACATPEALAGAWGRALDAVGATTLDVDVEADVPADTVAAAMAVLQRGRAVPISLTLPVAGTETALTDPAMALVRAAAAHDVALRVNVMAMNFPAAGPWADAVLSAGEATVRRLGEVWPGADPAELRRRVSVTVMIGRNDQGMVTTLADARTVARAARDRGFGGVGMWSVARDDGCPQQEVAQPDCSGVAQTPNAFLGALRGPFAAD